MISYNAVFWLISIHVCTETQADIHHYLPKTSNVYGFKVLDFEEQSVNMSRYKGKHLLIVNLTFINDAATSNINILNDILNKYSDEGLMILGFLSTQISTKEPDADATILTAIKVNKDKFHIFSKLNINDDKCKSPLWIYLKRKAQEIRNKKRSAWIRYKAAGLIALQNLFKMNTSTINNKIDNFTQFIVNREGQVIGSYPPTLVHDKLILSKTYIEEYFKTINDPDPIYKKALKIVKEIGSKKKLVKWQDAIDVYEFEVEDCMENIIKISKYKNDVLFIVNVASSDEFELPIFSKLLAIKKKYSSRGLTILCFPCNQINQELSTNDVIPKFTKKFTMFSIVDVNYEYAHPFWKYLKKEAYGDESKIIEENFTTFVMNRDGKFIKTIPPQEMIKIDIATIEDYVF